ncbi:MAG: Signal peptidase I [Prochlorococcus sp.]
MDEQKPKVSLLKKGGRIGAILGVAWIGVHIVVPLALLRVPGVQRWLAAVENRLPFDIPGIG